MGEIVLRSYMPWYWSELMINFQDSNALLGNFYLECKLDKCFTSISHIASVEGLTELGSRAAGSPMEFLALIDAMDDPLMST